MMKQHHAMEVARGERFEFGANWERFLKVLNDERIAQAGRSLCDMLSVDNLRGKSFLDIGSGSGLFSLAARQLGATVYSFDYDPKSVACTMDLKQRYFPEDSQWTIEEGSALDRDYLSRLGQFDVVHSWGVLHHTGAMWEALSNLVPLVAEKGRLFIAIYNDQGGWSRRWKVLKRIYNMLPRFLKSPYAMMVMGPRELKFLTLASFKGKPWMYFNNIINYSKCSMRGMSYWHDYIDWIGGYPFEVAKPGEIFNFYRVRGFRLDLLQTCAGGLGCNQFVFMRGNSDPCAV
jgi:2-polyprenyl-3-methyl-5-hydroxy-6-metoxy-1,4-benzoquinol methylase